MRTPRRRCAIKRPWFRNSDCRWYVEHLGKQVPLGKDPRFDSAPARKPKEPPPEVAEAYRRLMAGEMVEQRTVDDCARRYLAHLKATDAHVKAVRLHLGWFADYRVKGRRIGDLRMNDLKKHMLTDYLQDRGKSWKPNTSRYAITRVLACLNFCEREQYIEANPLKGYERPKVQRRDKLATPEELDRLEAAASPALRDILRCLRITGARPGELRSLTVADCDLENGFATVVNKTRDQTGMQTRPVFLPREAIEIIRGRIGGRTEGHVFLTPRGLPWRIDHFEQSVRRTRDAAGLGRHVTAYIMRHFFLSHAINRADANVAQVALQAGHQDLKMLMRHYLHTDPGAMREAVERMAGEKGE